MRTHSSSISDVIKTLPPEVFEQNLWMAWKLLLTSILSVTASYVVLACTPWFLLLPVWFITGTALTGFFVIAHECGHRSFFRSPKANDYFGHILLLPLIYPFHPWRLRHNIHHRFTNRLDKDNAWTPLRKIEFAALPNSLKWIYHLLRSKLWWICSIYHQFFFYFNWNQFEGKQRKQARRSVLLVLGSMAVVFPLLFFHLGTWGIVKYWLMPWLGYHFWMSTFTLIHHTSLDVPFYPAGEWNSFESQLMGTVHCNYPAWIEFLCHDINVHIPHHVSTAIPAYRLKAAYAILKRDWGHCLLAERKFGTALMRELLQECHLYDSKKNYMSVPCWSQKNS